MSYGDGLFVIGAYEQADATGEGVDSVVSEVNADDATQVYWRHRSPFQMSVMGFGIVITEIDAAPTTAPIIQLNVLAATATATSRTLLSMTIDAPLFAVGDGRLASVTTLADAGLTIGRCVLYTGTGLPAVVLPGEILQAELTTTGDGATLAFQMVALARIDGYDLTLANVATLLAAA